MSKNYKEWFKYYENATKEQIIEDVTQDNLEIEILKKQLQQKENIIKEVREYIDKWKFETAGNGACMEYEDIQDILHILDKENNEKI